MLSTSRPGREKTGRQANSAGALKVLSRAQDVTGDQIDLLSRVTHLERRQRRLQEQKSASSLRARHWETVWFLFRPARPSPIFPSTQRQSARTLFSSLVAAAGIASAASRVSDAFMTRAAAPPEGLLAVSITLPGPWWPVAGCPERKRL
ncbi:hypothetical protein MTO96_013626 [Rhipicephalus appendiculatus]